MRRRQTLGMDAYTIIASPEQLVLGHKIALAQKLVRPGGGKQGHRGAVTLDDLQGPEGRVSAAAKSVAAPDIDTRIDVSVAGACQLD